MKNRYYETISPSLAKKRIAKLVEAEHKAYEEFKEVEKLDSESLSEYRKTKWLGYRDALYIMGIVETDLLED